ncbi:N-succinylarginine dihydrolase, partial [Erythrobacter donghaensis]
LRLRVVADPATVDPRFIATPERLDAIEKIIAAHWPERITPGDLVDPALAETVGAARRALLDALDLSALA